MDFKNAFVHADIERDVYMAIPKFGKGDSSQEVYKLQTSLYGLKEASLLNS